MYVEKYDVKQQILISDKVEVLNISNFWLINDQKTKNDQMFVVYFEDVLASVLFKPSFCPALEITLGQIQQDPKQSGSWIRKVLPCSLTVVLWS